jgi:hypothetical protein
VVFFIAVQAALDPFLPVLTTRANDGGTGVGVGDF